MARRSGFLHAIARAQQQAARQSVAQMRAQAQAQTQAARAAERAQRAYLNAQKADQKERTRLYIESQVAQVALQNERLEKDVARLESLLTETLANDEFINLDKLKQAPNIPQFTPGSLAVTEPPPVQQRYFPPELSGIQKFIPGAKEKHAQETAKAQERYWIDANAHAAREVARQQRLWEARAMYERQVVEIRQQVAAQHADIDRFKQDFAAGSPPAIVEYFTMVLAASSYPENFPQHAKLAYVPESRQLVVEYDLPPLEAIPTVGSYKYMKTKDEVIETPRPLAQRKTLYSSVIAQVTLRTLKELFKADRAGYVETIVFNGYVDTIDKGTGRPLRTCLVTLRTSRDIFMQLDLSRVDPLACLKVLNASVSKSPTELAPVRPVLEFNMVDPRFIEETDVLSELDQRPNLMDLSPSEFESLITNLFQKMGLETRLTQASRDGGVDCVAYDPRPIFGGKVVIQAKRYKHTVGVSAVRDLFGTVQNEGASKGILVTTSGYGKASFDFADGKPLELLSGSNLLYLLKEHAGVEARIVMPEDWKDPLLDTHD
ncbi:MAG: restriction endonuclease [Ktedonobacteraceae bacterium]